MKTRLAKTLAVLQSHQDKTRLAAMKRFRIPVANALGISNPVINSIAKKIGKDQELSLQLWQTHIHEAQLLATLVGEYSKVTPDQMDQWITSIDSWAICDGVCGNLFCKTAFAYEKAMAWSYREAEFEKRAGFALMAMIAVHDKKGDDKNLFPFFDRMIEEAYDERNFVRKGINWALRQCGKRSFLLHEKAIKTAAEIGFQPGKSSKWIAADALRELNSNAVLERLKVKTERQVARSGKK